MSRNDLPGAEFVGQIHEFRVTGDSLIEGYPPYDFTFRSPDRAEAAQNAWTTANSSSFVSAVTNIQVSHRKVDFTAWQDPWTIDEFGKYIDRATTAELNQSTT